MVVLKRVVLDVLKPRYPNVVEFAKALAEQRSDYRVHLTVAEMDEKTETLVVVVEGEDIQLDVIENTITELGGSLHSIDEVEVEAIPAPESDR